MYFCCSEDPKNEVPGQQKYNSKGGVPPLKLYYFKSIWEVTPPLKMAYRIFRTLAGALGGAYKNFCRAL